MLLKVFLLKNLKYHRVNKLLHFTAFSVLVYFCFFFLIYFFLMLCLTSYISCNFIFLAVNEREETLESM